MGAYSLDLRKRIVDAVERGEHTKREIAEMFMGLLYISFFVSCGIVVILLLSLTVAGQ